MTAGVATTQTPLQLIGNGTIVPFDTGGRVLHRGAVLVEGNAIKAIGPDADLRQRFPQASYVDAEGGVVLPGFLCTHTHFYGAFARGMAIPGEAPRTFMEILRRLWWHLDKLLTPEDIRASALVFLVDAVRGGTTCIIDHHASPNAIEGSLDLIAEAAAGAGLRVCLAYEVTDRDGAERARRGIEENVRFIRALRAHPAAREGLVSASFGLHASFTVSQETLEEAIAAGSSLGVGFHLHVAEDRADVEDAQQKYGRGLVARLAGAGVLGPRSIAAHCVHIGDGEISLLVETDTNVVHNPRSNMNNAVGVAPIPAMLQRGVRVGLGNDGFSMSMLQEMKVAYLLHKVSILDPRAMPADQVLKVAFFNNAEIARRLFDPFWTDGRVPHLGTLAEGGPADLVIMDYHPPTPLTEDNLPWHIIFGLDAMHVRSTMVNGRWLMKDRRLLTLDEEAIYAHARELALRLWQRGAQG